MGNASSSRQGKQERDAKERIHANMTRTRVEEIEQFQQQVLKRDEGKQLQVNEQKDLLRVSEIAKVQVQRGGEPLTKADLVAIILRLRKETDITKYTRLTVKDLNLIIRNIIYEPPAAARALDMAPKQKLPRESSALRNLDSMSLW